MKVGEISKTTGISVRTLHYYEEISLLSPSFRTDSGHRIYEYSGVVKLQQIRSLQQLGFSLEEIKESLGNPSCDILKILAAHQEQILQKISTMQTLSKRLKKITRSLESETDNISTDYFLDTIHFITTLDKYFDEKTADRLRKNHQQTKIDQWEEWIDEVKHAMTQKIRPKSLKARSLAKKWQKLITDLLGKDQKETQVFLDLLEDESALAHKHGLDDKMLQFLRSILKEMA